MGTAQDMLDLFDGDTDRLAELERAGRRIPGLHRRFHQRRAGLPAVAGPRRGLRAGAGRRRAVVAGAHHPADGGPRTGDRGLRARPGRLVGDAAQDEHPLVRAGQRPAGGAARLRVDGGRTGGRAVERGRRVLLGGAPGGAARRVLRHRRADRDVPDGARRVRRLPGGDPARTRPLPAVPGHHPDPDRGGARRGRAGRPRTR